MRGFLCSDWVKRQTTHLERTGSRWCANKWAAQLAGRLIDIVFEMWNHRNETLHKKDNSITEQKHEELNKTIEQIYSDLPNMRLFTHAEQRFFKYTTVRKVQEQTIHRKGQWIKKAQSILQTFKDNNQNGKFGAAHILLRAMDVQPTNRNSNRNKSKCSKDTPSQKHQNKPKTKTKQKQQQTQKQKQTQKIQQNIQNYMSVQNKLHQRRFKDQG